MFPYPYLHALSPFSDPHGYGWITVIYFLFIVTMGALVLPTLLVAVITASTDDATRQIENRQELNERWVL